MSSLTIGQNSSKGISSETALSTVSLSLSLSQPAVLHWWEERPKLFQINKVRAIMTVCTWNRHRPMPTADDGLLQYIISRWSVTAAKPRQRSWNCRRNCSITTLLCPCGATEFRTRIAGSTACSLLVQLTSFACVAPKLVDRLRTTM